MVGSCLKVASFCSHIAAVYYMHSIPEHLQYSTIFWDTHLYHDAINETNIRDAIEHLIGTPKLLFWLECLSVQQHLERSLIALERVGELFQEQLSKPFQVSYPARGFIHPLNT